MYVKKILTLTFDKISIEYFYIPLCTREYCNKELKEIKLHCFALKKDPIQYDVTWV